MTINVPKPEVLQAAFAHIQQNLHAWDQGGWLVLHRKDVPEENTCGTTACLAGWIAFDAGYTPAELAMLSVCDVALEALGFEKLESEMCTCGCGMDFGSNWEMDAIEFREIFGITYSNIVDGGNLKFTQQAFDHFKSRVSELTGVQL